MTYSFEGTAEEVMTMFLATAKRATEELASGAKATAQHTFCAAMVSLVRLYDRQAVLGPVAADRLARFRHESAALLATSKLASAYVLWATFLAEGANDNQWYELSIRRSAIQSLIDDYAGAVVELVDRQEVEELDVELRRLGQDDEQGPIDPAYIPRGLPETHWWWRYPEQFK